MNSARTRIMGDFVNSGWSIWVTVISILGVVFVLWLLWTQRSWLGQKTVVTEDTGHEWDGIRELNHPLPRWWIVMYLGLSVIGIGVGNSALVGDFRSERHGAQCQSHDHGQHSCNDLLHVCFLHKNLFVSDLTSPLSPAVYNVNIIML